MPGDPSARLPLTRALRQAQAARWECRYEDGPDELSVLVVTLAESGALDLDPAQRGIDGVRYQAGAYGSGSLRHGDPVVLVRTRGGCELVAGWPDLAAARIWAGDRVAGDGPLTWPAHAAGSRAVREEQVLACMLRYPWQASALASVLRWHTYQSDLRDEVASALAVIARRGGTVSSAAAGDEVRHRYTEAPAWAREEAGGPDVPRAAAYLRRLACTEVTPDAAMTAARTLAGQQAGPSGPGPRPPGAPLLPPPRQAHGPEPDGIRHYR
jgi:hypothetical protein